MKKIVEWFKNLSRVGKFAVISAVALSGMFVYSTGASRTPASEVQTETSLEAVNKKEPLITTKVETETQTIAFEKTTVESSSLVKGSTQIQTNGVNGVKTLTHTIEFTDGVETNRSTKEEVTTQPVSEITLIGTYVAPAPEVKPAQNCDSNYSGCVPVVSYDLDCKDIGYTVSVLGYDKHRLDGDKDGYGCE